MTGKAGGNVELTDKLLELFEREKQRSPLKRGIVFWYDEDAEGRDLEEIRVILEKQEVHVWELTKNNVFQTKYLLEVKQREASFLLYAPFAKPAPEQNGLLDILLYATEFKTDETALLAEELGLEPNRARPFLQRYKLFFREKRRKERFRRLMPLQGEEGDWKAVVFAVLAQTNSPQPTDVFRAVIQGGLNEKENKALVHIRKFAPVEDFYQWMYTHFRLNETETPSLQEVFATIIWCHAVTCSPKMEEVLPRYETKMPNTCYVFLEDWLRDERGRNVLKPLVQQLEKDWGLYGKLKELPLEPSADCLTFPLADQVVLENLEELLLHHKVTGLGLETMIDKRLSGYWAEEKELRHAYQFFSHALSLILYKEEGYKVHYQLKGQEWIKAYTEHDYKIDQTYRKMMWVYNQAGMPDSLTPLRDNITRWVEQEFLPDLADFTDQVVAGELASHWPIRGVLQQSNFFQERVAPLIAKSTGRVFVIISDALRYEAGVELFDKLRRRLNAEVTLEPMQASLPSYTPLGMGALLPGKVSRIDEEGTVYVEDLPAKDVNSREKILQKKVPEAAAFRLDDWIHLGKEKGLQTIRGQRVIYLYHNRIDATGDQQVTETYTFDDVQQGLEELERVVGKLTGTFGAKRIFITADHGFLYQHSPIEADRLTERVDGKVLKQHRRFALGQELTVPPGTQRVSLSYLNLEQEVVVAKGLNRFKAGGGMKFVHGGAMPQEVVVPVIDYREIHGQGRKKEEKHVDVRVAMRSKIITHYQFNVVFFQEQKVTLHLRPRYLRAAFYKGDQRISNEVTLVFDSEQEALHRHTEKTFTLIEEGYPMGDPCFLRLEDVTGPKTKPYIEEPFELRVYDIEIT